MSVLSLKITTPIHSFAEIPVEATAAERASAAAQARPNDAAAPPAAGVRDQQQALPNDAAPPPAAGVRDQQHPANTPMPAAGQERGDANPPAPQAAALRRDVRNLGRNGLPTIVFGNGDAALAQAAPNPSTTTSSATAPSADRLPPAFVDNDGVLRRAESISAAELLQNMAPPPPAAGFLSGSPVTGAVPPMPPQEADWSAPDSFSSPQFYSGLMGLPMPTPMSPMMGLAMPMPMPTMSPAYGDPRSC